MAFAPDSGTAIELGMDGGIVGTFMARHGAFESGSEGYSLSGKVLGSDGSEYQVSFSAVRINSQYEPEASARQGVVKAFVAAREAAKAAKKLRGNAANGPVTTRTLSPQELAARKGAE